MGSDLLEVTLDVKERSVPNRGAEFTLKACNTGPETVERHFPDAQRYDFAVKRNDDVVWRWSDGRSFAQVTGREEWEPGECKTWKETWDGMTTSGAPAPSGEYEAVGVLKTPNPQHAKAVEFCLDIC
jgi:hypothetical protein